MRVRGAIASMAAAIGVLAVAWVAVPPASVPLYDGIGFPDEPYRYVDPPPGYQHTPPPSDARATDDAAGGTNSHDFYVNSAEYAPQVSLFMAAQTLTTPANATTVAVSATPEAADGSVAYTTIDGNVYRVEGGVVRDGTTVSQGVSLRAGSTSDTITLRATSARKRTPSFVYRPRPGAPWRALPATAAGRDIYRASFAGFGDYALALTGRASGGTPAAIWVAVGAVVSLLALIVLAIRGRRSRPVGA